MTLRRPEKRNALSIELAPSSRTRSATPLGGEEGTGCVVLTGAGNAFCSGMDTSQFGGDRANRTRLVETSTLAFEAVGACHRPVVAAVNGPALAGGFALGCSATCGSPTQAATFGYPELPRGIPPSYAAARAVLPATVAQELCLTGRIVRATEAQRLGIVREVVSGDVLRRARSRSPSGSRRSRARRSSRPSARRCSSADTCGASLRRGGARLSPRAAPRRR